MPRRGAFDAALRAARAPARCTTPQRALLANRPLPPSPLPTFLSALLVVRLLREHRLRCALAERERVSTGRMLEFRALRELALVLSVAALRAPASAAAAAAADNNGDGGGGTEGAGGGGARAGRRAQ